MLCSSFSLSAMTTAVISLSPLEVVFDQMTAVDGFTYVTCKDKGVPYSARIKKCVWESKNRVCSGPTTHVTHALHPAIWTFSALSWICRHHLQVLCAQCSPLLSQHFPFALWATPTPNIWPITQQFSDARRENPGPVNGALLSSEKASIPIPSAQKLSSWSVVSFWVR